MRLLDAGSLVPVPDAGDASSLAMAAVATAWLLLWGLRAAAVPSHEWRWHVLRAIATTALAADELHAFASHALYLPYAGGHRIALVSAAAFAVATLALVVRRLRLGWIAKGRIPGWTIRKARDVAAHLPYAIPSEAGERCRVLVRVGGEPGDAYRSPRAELEVARVPERALKPMIGQLGDVGRGVSGTWPGLLRFLGL